MKKFSNYITESNDRTLSLFHGGRGLEFSWRESISHKKGNWEYGPGLYLTTHWDTANKYAKGGGKLYYITIKEGKELTTVDIPLQDVFSYTKYNVIGSKRKDVDSRIERLSNDGFVNAEYVLNVIINENAIQNSKSALLKDFFVEHGIDYHIVHRYGGRPETVFVVMDTSHIVKVSVLSPKEVGKAVPFELDDNFK